MAVPGKWTLHYDWGCDGSYSQTSMTLNANGTWTNGEGHKGQWVQNAGMLVFNFSHVKTIYAGNIASSSVTGISTTFSGLNGCFYMIKQATLARAAEIQAGKAPERVAEKADSAGGGGDKK